MGSIRSKERPNDPQDVFVFGALTVMHFSADGFVKCLPPGQQGDIVIKIGEGWIGLAQLFSEMAFPFRNLHAEFIRFSTNLVQQVRCVVLCVGIVCNPSDGSGRVRSHLGLGRDCCRA